jgi:hypothetical protein
LMTGSGVAFTTIAAAAMKDDLPGDQSIGDNIVILSSRQLGHIYRNLT